ncbi:MAG: hypothetical protein L3J79_04740 [Candidatus Marinimicrobia bacterium]|nr:hypothetical protein [Candidatus Neomarinimicrobiota bacterium]
MKKLTLMTTILAVLILASCSTMSFLPTEGGAAKFNLATVDYVKAENVAQQDQLLADLAANITTMLDSLLMEDRAALDSLGAQIDLMNASITDFASRIDSAETLTTKSLATMSKELTTVKTNASSTRMVIRRINDNIDNLPVKALETFNEAINEYLKKDAAETE